jgi:ParB family chromosome partitioning protein
MAQQHGLGRGLASLIPPKVTSDEVATTVPIPQRVAATPIAASVAPKQTATTPVSAIPEPLVTDTDRRVLEIPTRFIVPNPHQPRTDFSPERLEELALSIREHGILQPLIVTKRGETYELIAGERRFQAAKKIGLATVPVIVREAEEQEKFELAIIENIQRHDLNALEEAKAFRRLIDEFQLTQEEIAKKMGKSRSLIANTLRLLQLPIEIQKAILSGIVSEGHAKAILSVDGKEKQMALYEVIVKEQLTVREAEQRARQESIVKVKRHAAMADPETRAVEEQLADVLGTRVRIARVGKGGRITIEYYSNEDLEHLVKKIKQPSL